MEVDCSRYREAVSTRLDGEVPPIPSAELDEHLAGCVACRDWQDRARKLSRRLRVRPAEPLADIAGRMPVAGQALSRRPRWTRQRWSRWALGIVAVAQLMLGGAQVIGGDVSHHDALMAGHLFNEGTAWNLALGAGLLLGALRVRLVPGLLSVLSVFLLVLGIFSVVDVLAGAVSAGRLWSHGLLVLALALLLVVWRDGSRGESGAGFGDDGGEMSEGSGGTSDSPDDGTGGPHLRPVSYRRVA